MACTPPITNSPGHMFWKYEQSALFQHTFSARFIAGVDISNVPPLRVEAARIAAAWKDMVTNSFACYAWGIRRADGSLYYVESFATPYVGAATPITGMPAYHSTTLQFNGHGNPGGAGDCAGPEHTDFYIGNAYNILAGMKRIDGSLFGGIQGLLDAFNTSTYLPADKYGQQVSYLTSAPIQFNSHAQKVIGS